MPDMQLGQNRDRNFPARCVTCARYATRQWQSKQATVQMELPGKVRDLCQICNWARTVTLIASERLRLVKG